MSQPRSRSQTQFFTIRYSYLLKFYSVIKKSFKISFSAILWRSDFIKNFIRKNLDFLPNFLVLFVRIFQLQYIFLFVMAEQNIKMPEGKAPHFPQQPVARQNDDGSLELECFLEAQPVPDIKWFYENNELKSSERFSFRLENRGTDAYSSILQIKDLADSDAGAYRCAIVNPFGKGNANFNLKLTGFSSPTFIEKPQISSRDDGRVMIMEFKAKSILKPTFVWQKGDEIVAESDRYKIILKETGNHEFYAALEIVEPKKEKDAGQFVCTAKNESGKLTATFSVKFEVPQGAPTFTRKPQILQKTSDSGDPAIVFDIGFQADQNPEVIWLNPKSKKMKESSRIKFGLTPDGGANTYTAQLELKNYKAKDSGTYTCNIKNDAGEANVELTLNIEGDIKEEISESLMEEIDRPTTVDDFN
ncbi:unnamed protein product [Meloidogyne enterolobii]|uniref:Uncharacterized protein n=1 Tax=Meloidogyne enterolobii TaxID=390850 RepID=A0ACB0XL91_MELEN